jgi:putative ABC transport system permease protein
MRSPGFTAAAVLCLGLGIGATTAIFSVVNAVVMRPLAYAQPDRLVRLYTEFPGFPGGGLRKFWTSRAEYLDLKRDLKSWESLDGWTTSAANLGGGAEPLRVTVCIVTGGLLRSLGVPPTLGRVHTAQDDAPGAPLAVTISHGLWMRAFGGDRGIVGKQVRVDGRNATVAGVMPPGFAFPPGETDPPELWLPLQIDPANPGGRGNHFLYLLGRLKAGVTLAQARQEIAALVRDYGAKAAPKTHLFHPENHPIVSFPFHEEVVGGVRDAMWMMLAAVGFVLLISCVNVANLLLARAESRQREVAIRTAMGANSFDLLRQFFIEGLVLSTGGAIVGLALTFAGLRSIVAAGEQSIPRASEISVDWRVLLFALAISLATGLIFGLAPLIHGIRGRIGESLKAAGGRTTASVEANRLRKLLVAGELALALVLLIGSGLMVRAFWNLQAVNIGVRPVGILTFRIALPQAVYPEAAAVRSVWSRLHDRLARIPGVQSASFASGLPPIRPLNANDTEIEGFVPKPGGPIQNIDFYQVVGPKFFETMSVPLVEGRYLDERDGDGGAQVVVVSHTTARAYWPGQSAIGKRIRPSFNGAWRTVVGVVGDIKNAGIDRPSGTEIFLPYAQVGAPRAMFVLLRSQGDPMRLLGPARAALAEIDASIPIAQARPFEEVIGRAQARPRFLTLLLALFSGVALALAALGIYGVMSYAVAQRTSEFGVRMAIGAQPADVLRLVLRQGVLLGLGGVAAGALGAVALTRFLRGLLFGIDSLDPVTFVAMAALLTAVILAACLLPARRATKVDPLVALRYE